MGAPQTPIPSFRRTPESSLFPSFRRKPESSAFKKLDPGFRRDDETLRASR